MLPNATRLANSAIAATVAVFDRRMIRIFDLPELTRTATLTDEKRSTLWRGDTASLSSPGSTRRSSKNRPGVLDCPVKPGNDMDRVRLIAKCANPSAAGG